MTTMLYVLVNLSSGEQADASFTGYVEVSHVREPSGSLQLATTLCV